MPSLPIDLLHHIKNPHAKNKTIRRTPPTYNFLGYKIDSPSLSPGTPRKSRSRSGGRKSRKSRSKRN